METKEHTYPRINPEEQSILTNATLYKKSNAEDILSNPGLVNIDPYYYEDMEGNLYEVALYKGHLYARYVIPDLDNFPLGEIPPYIKQLREKVLEGCKKEGLGIFHPSIIARQKELHGTGAQGYVDGGNEMYIKRINDQLFSHNTEIGNIVIHDFEKRKNYGRGGSAPH